MVYKLKKNIEFRIVYRRGKSFANDILVLYVLKNNKNKECLSCYFIYTSIYSCFFVRKNFTDNYCRTF